LIIDLYKLHIGELFNSRRKRLRNAVGSAVGLALSFQVDIKNAIPKINAGVSNESVPDGGQACVFFRGIRPFEIFVDNGPNRVD
jgi:hypothetical protein